MVWCIRHSVCVERENVFHNAKVKRGERSLRGLTSLFVCVLVFFVENLIAVVTPEDKVYSDKCFEGVLVHIFFC